jgi:Rgg/GadR/MutR family transcriptional activator
MPESSQIFKELREMTQTSYADLHEILGKSAIIRFEAGEGLPNFEKIKKALKHMGFTASDFAYLIEDKRVIQTYGRIFHDLRFQQGYREDFFEQFGVNVARLKLFEEGRIMLPYSILDEMLLEMHIPERDYSYWVNGGQVDWFIQSIQRLELAHYRQDLETMQMLEKCAHDFAQQQELKMELPDDLADEQDYAEERVTRQYADYRILELTAKKYRAELTDEEEIEISDFLFGIEIWTEFDLGLLALNGGRLDSSAAKLILDEIYQNFERYKGSRIYREHLVQTTGRAAAACIKEGELEEAEAFLKQGQSTLYDISARVQGMFRFTKAQLAFARGEVHGNFEMLRVIDFFDFIGEEIAKNYAQYLYDDSMLSKN